MVQGGYCKAFLELLANVFGRELIIRGTRKWGYNAV